MLKWFSSWGGPVLKGADDSDEREYRQFLVEAHRQASRDTDRVLIILAGGALGISIAFVRDLAPEPTGTGWLTASWVLLAAAIGMVFASLLTSQIALRKGITQVDAGSAWTKPVGGVWSVVTTVLNGLAAASTLFGLGFLVRFALLNQGG